MSGVVVDVLIALVVVSMAAFGYRSGLLKAASSMIGLAVGLAIAVPVVSVVGREIDSSTWRITAVVGLLVLIANAGYISGMLLGERLRARLRRGLSRGLDRTAGGLLSAVLAVVLVWMVALPLATSPVPGVSQAIRGSAILPQVDAVMPDAARTLYDAIGRAIDEQGLPDVVGPLQQTEVADVGEPDGSVAGQGPVVQASESVVRVVGQAPQCGRVVGGSGFAYADDRVVTNAHVVAGTSSLEVRGASGTRDATVVYADENLDLAVLRVDGLDLPALPLDTAPQPAGADVVVAGHPLGGPLSLVAAKVRAQGAVTGPSFRGDDIVTRNVLVLRGTVVSGNSGGPVLGPQGAVVGVVFGAAADASDVGYALSIGPIEDELAAAASATAEVVSGACYP